MSETLRPSLPASSTDFDLPPASTHSPNGDIPPLMLRLRRPSLLAPKSYCGDNRLHSPLSESFTVPISRKGSQAGTSEAESESDRERMWTDSSTSSENVTPPLPSFKSESDIAVDVEGKNKSASRRPSTPPRAVDVPELSKGLHLRRLSYPIKQPRILSLQEESKPEENEVKSEAQFQRLLASCSVNPSQPKTPRGTSDCGRYPEEAGEEDVQREDTPSDDDGEEDPTFAFGPPLSESLSSSKPATPAHSVNGDEMWMDSPGFAMDVDMQFGSPSIPSSLAQWRYTPPPTTSAVRTNKRKLEDRFDPYPSAKRRAVSPSISHYREHPLLLSPSLGGPRSSGTSSRPPMPIPISIPNSTASSLASSPTISQPIAIPRPNGLGSASIASSPTMRNTMALSSPIMRAMSRRRGEEDRREIDGAGEGVNGLRLQ